MSCRKWDLRRVAEVQLALRPLQMTWNGAIPTELAYALEDGSVHLLDVASCLDEGRTAGHASSPAAAVGFHSANLCFCVHA